MPEQLVQMKHSGMIFYATDFSKDTVMVYNEICMGT